MSGPHDLSPSRRTRVLIGVATFWPPLYFVLFLAFIGFMFFTAAQRRSMRIPAALTIIFPLHCLTIVLCFVLTGLYIVHAATSDRHSQEMRIIWIISLFMGNMFAFPVYWWLYLRPGDASTPPA